MKTTKPKTLKRLGEIYRIAPETLCRLRKQGAPVQSPADFWRWMDAKPGRKPELHKRMVSDLDEVNRIASAFHDWTSCDAFRAAIELPE